MVKQSATLDTSFWIHAHKAGLSTSVLDDFELHCSLVVAAELKEDFEAGRLFWKLVQDGQVLRAESRLDAVTMFGSGERSAMNLALEHPGWFLLIDDWRPLEAAQNLGIPAICSPVLVVKMFREGKLQLGEALRSLTRLTRTGTVSPRLLTPAAALLRLAAKEREIR